MEKHKVDMYVMNNAKYFDSSSIPFIRQRLESMSDESFMTLQSIEFKDPTTLLIISILVGSLGVDRFMLGETGMGVLKLLTGGCCGVLTIIDWFSISKKTKEYNLNKFNSVS